MLLAPIQLFGNSAILTTSAAPNTNGAVPVVYPGAAGMNLGTLGQPTNIRLLNTGTAMIWLNFAAGAAGAGAVIPTAGIGSSLGTPAPVVWIAPNIEVTLTLPCSIAALQGVANTPLGFWLNTISSVASQTFQMQLGDGT